LDFLAEEAEGWGEMAHLLGFGEDFGERVFLLEDDMAAHEDDVLLAAVVGCCCCCASIRLVFEEESCSRAMSAGRRRRRWKEIEKQRNRRVVKGETKEVVNKWWKAPSL
jgi:hypothetical protein